jgi:phosphoribosylformylglycinamidine cyclo-ligase
MAAKRSTTYADAGVSIGEADRATAKIKEYAQRTFDKNVLAGIGSFGAAYAIHNAGLKRPVLVSSADGVGTKLMLAFATGIHDTVGQCLVNHCVNDIAVQGARPLFFMDYFATGKLSAAVTAKVIRGLSKACIENCCALIGGETAEMPGMYRPGEYDLAGFIVGVVERSSLVTGGKIRGGDVLLGLPSTGLHTNGYSLARKLCFEVAHYQPETVVPEIGGPIGRELLKVHRSYLQALQLLAKHKLLRGAAHITGGGISGNTPRMLPEGVSARVKLGSWPVLPIFELLRKIGGLRRRELFRAFNMGIGLIVAVPARSKARALGLLQEANEAAYVIGEVVEGPRKVVYE